VIPLDSQGHKNEGSPVGLPLLVDLFFVRPAEEIVHGDIVEIGDFDEGFGGDVMLAGFIVAVCSLRTV
jgi:hypothetical protein